jgi:hypothetical protein
MTELQAPGCRVDEYQAGSFGRSQRLQAVSAVLLRVRVGEDLQVAGSVEGCEEEEFEGLGGQRGHTCGEYRLEALGDR